MSQFKPGFFTVKKATVNDILENLESGKRHQKTAQKNKSPASEKKSRKKARNQ